MQFDALREVHDFTTQAEGCSLLHYRIRWDDNMQEMMDQGYA